MRIGKRLFPYPILNSEKLYSHFKSSSFYLEYDEEISEDKQYYILKNLHCTVENEMLIELISAGRAEIVCMIECPSTMYRKNHVLPLERIDLRIPLTDLNNKVYVSAFIVAKEDIDDYYSEDFLDDYDGIPFSVEKHDILAADDGYVNNIDFNDFDDNKNASIFIVIKDKEINNGTMQVEYDSDKITISLPEEQWNMYDKTKRIKKYEGLYFSIIAIPALGYALSCLQKDDPNVDLLRIEYKWFDSFSEAYKKNHGTDLDDDIFRKMNTNLEAQVVFDGPVSNAIDEIFGFTIGMTGGEEYGD